jgi:hypothetical protein
MPAPADWCEQGRSLEKKEETISFLFQERQLQLQRAKHDKRAEADVRIQYQVPVL